MTTSASDFGTITVVGAGTLGASWAALFALSGCQVRVVDPSAHAALQVSAALARARPIMAAMGRLSPAPTAPQVGTDLGAALVDAALVLEALPEDLALKQQAYADIEARVAPTTLIASSSSGLKPSELQQQMQHPERFLIAHPCNPAYLMPVIEIVGGRSTAAWALDQADTLFRALGKRTLRLQREVTGHLINRLQAALWREAVHLVAEGYASVADVDRAVTLGLGARWAVCGPHEIFHLAGGQDGMAGFLDRLGPSVEAWWASLGTPVLDAATRQLLIDGMAKAGEAQAQPESVRDLRIVRAMAASSATEN